MFVNKSQQEAGKGEFVSNSQELRGSDRGHGSPGSLRSKGTSSTGTGTGGEEVNNNILSIGDMFPNFSADSSMGKVNFTEWLGDSWGVLFIHPKAFTPVCTTELAHLTCQSVEFEKRNCKIAALTCDSPDNISRWMNDIQDLSKKPIHFPIICDPNLDIVKSLGLLKTNSGGTDMNIFSRAVYFISPQKMIKALFIYPEFVGRNYDEVLRVLDALAIHCEKHLDTPVNWHKGEKCLLPSNVSEDEVGSKFGHVETLKPYLRMTEQGF